MHFQLTLCSIYDGFSRCHPFKSGQFSVTGATVVYMPEVWVSVEKSTTWLGEGWERNL